jgi:hypothetical protein
MGHPEVPEGYEPDPGEGTTLSRTDFILRRRAARSDWGVPDELKAEALWQAMKLIADPKGNARDKMAAARFVVAAERNDLAAARLKLDAPPDPEARPPRILIPGADGHADDRQPA